LIRVSLRGLDRAGPCDNSPSTLSHVGAGKVKQMQTTG
jgi:hypothetical protein